MAAWRNSHMLRPENEVSNVPQILMQSHVFAVRTERPDPFNL